MPDPHHDATPAYEPPDIERPASASPTEPELEQETPGGADSAGHDAYAAWRFADYRLYFFGSFLAGLGGQMQNLAIMWELSKRSTDARVGSLLLGYVGLVEALPVILLALPAGQAADRYSRKLLVLVTQALLVVSALWLAWLSAHQSPLSWIYGCLFVIGCARAYSGPAASAMLVQLVPDELLTNAVTWNSTRWQISSMVGPALGGFLIYFLGGATWIYVIDAVCMLFMLGFVAFIRGRPQVRSREPATLQTLFAGVHFVKENKLILATITMDLFAVLLGGAVMLLPVYADHILHVDAFHLGCLRSAPAVGALVMALSLAHRGPMQRAGQALLWAVAGFGVATIVFGISRNFWLSMAALAVTGMLDNVSVVVRHTLVQDLTPDQMRGRVSAVNSVFIGASNELGGFESGVVARFLGPVASVVYGGLGTILVVGATNLIWPEMGRLGSLESAADEARERMAAVGAEA